MARQIRLGRIMKRRTQVRRGRVKGEARQPLEEREVAHREATRDVAKHR